MEKKPLFPEREEQDKLVLIQNKKDFLNTAKQFADEFLSSCGLNDRPSISLSKKSVGYAGRYRKNNVVLFTRATNDKYSLMRIVTHECVHYIQDLLQKTGLNSDNIAKMSPAEVNALLEKKGYHALSEQQIKDFSAFLSSCPYFSEKGCRIMEFDGKYYVHAEHNAQSKLFYYRNSKELSANSVSAEYCYKKWAEEEQLNWTKHYDVADVFRDITYNTKQACKDERDEDYLKQQIKCSIAPFFVKHRSENDIAAFDMAFEEKSASLMSKLLENYADAIRDTDAYRARIKEEEYKDRTLSICKEKDIPLLNDSEIQNVLKQEFETWQEINNALFIASQNNYEIVAVNIDEMSVFFRLKESPDNEETYVEDVIENVSENNNSCPERRFDDRDDR